MKILSYNINKCTQEKIDKVLAMNADIMVLPECARYDEIKLPQDYSMEWIGDNAVSWKGLGVIWKTQHEVVIAPWYNCEHKYILPLIVDRRFLLFATWPTKVLNGKQSYPQILLDALKEYQQYIQSYPTLMCGDFNCYTGQSGVSKATGTFEQCIEFWKATNSLAYTTSVQVRSLVRKARQLTIISSRKISLSLLTLHLQISKFSPMS